MSLEAARDLSVTDLLHMLCEKLEQEYTRLRETRLPPALSAASVELEVSVPRLAGVAMGSDSSELYSSKPSKLKHTMFGRSSPLYGTRCDPSTSCHQRSYLASLEISLKIATRMRVQLFR
jgi:hypothetical protein